MDICIRKSWRFSFNIISLEDGEISLFIDEIHRLSTNIEILYSAMEDFKKVDIMLGKDYMVLLVIEWNLKVATIGATMAGKLSKPFKDELGYNIGWISILRRVNEDSIKIS